MLGKSWRTSKEQLRCHHPSFPLSRDCSRMVPLLCVSLFSFLPYAAFPTAIPFSLESFCHLCGECWERLSLPVYKQRKSLPGQPLLHLLGTAINIPNCFSRQKCKDNIFPTAEGMKGRMQNMKTPLEFFHCFKHKSFISVFITMCRGHFVLLFPGFFPNPIHGAETNK